MLGTALEQLLSNAVRHNDPDAWAHERSGIGTGLSLVVTVVEQLGGTIEFGNNQPEGTVVTITLDRWTED